MNVALFFISHKGIASNLLTIGEAILQSKNNNLAYLEVTMDADVDAMLKTIDHRLKQLDTQQGLLIITDIYGSTPSNIAQTVANKYHADLISGVNLPMIIRLLNYRDENISSLLKKALDGARNGIQHNSSASDKQAADKII